MVCQARHRDFSRHGSPRRTLGRRFSRGSGGRRPRGAGGARGRPVVRGHGVSGTGQRRRQRRRRPRGADARGKRAAGLGG